MQYFYHYKSFDDSNEESLGRVENYFKQTIRLTPLEDFNDPFEGSFILKPTPQELAAIKEDNRVFIDYFNRFKNLQPELTIKMFKEKTLLNHEFNTAYSSIIPREIKDFFANHGAMCLTAIGNNMLMWTHYAKNHTGYCLIYEIDYDQIKVGLDMSTEEFNVHKKAFEQGTEIFSFSRDEHRFLFGKIRYQDLIPSIDLIKIAEIDDRYTHMREIAYNSVLVKFTQWKYEQEFRIIVSTNSKNSGLCLLSTYVPFLKNTGIILGTKMPEEIKTKIATLAENYKINVFHAKLSDNDYRIEIVKNP